MLTADLMAFGFIAALAVSGLIIIIDEVLS
jgi:hypothetical protein